MILLRILPVLALALLLQTRARAAELGLNRNDGGAAGGYTLVFPLRSTHTYLIDREGHVVQMWQSAYGAGQEAYLLDNGHLLRAANLAEGEAIFGGASQGGRIQEFDWNGDLVWDYKFHNEKQIRHHAITRMPNGNIMMIVWERKTPDELLAAGVDPQRAGGESLIDSLIEVKPDGATGGTIVWEWHAWDHLIQDHDSTKSNFGDVAAHPERIDANFARNGGGFGNLARFVTPRNDRQPARNSPPPPAEPQATDQAQALERLRGIGYVGASNDRPQFAGIIPDWLHVNAVSYNPELDQIMISPREFNEVWIIDHSTTTAEAASHQGGRHGRGGDLLFRWGNPRAYRAGTEADQRLFSQHDTQWIPAGLPGAGHMLVFNNGGGRPDGNYSSVDEVELPVNEAGEYPLTADKPTMPDMPVWSYASPDDFFAPLMSGAQRLSNGNTLICTGFAGRIFEVTPDKQVVWDYQAPDDGQTAPDGRGRPGPRGPGGDRGRPGRGGPGGFGPPGGFRGGPAGDNGNAKTVDLLAGPLRFVLQLEDAQMKQIGEFETAAAKELEAMLTAEQRTKLTELSRGGPFGSGGPPLPGLILSDDKVASLKLTEDQKSQLATLQTQADELIKRVLNEEQQRRAKEMRDRFAGGGRGGRGEPGGGRDRGGPGGFPFGGMGGVQGSTALFRAYQYDADFPGFKGKQLVAGKLLTELKDGGQAAD